MGQTAGKYATSQSVEEISIMIYQLYYFKLNIINMFAA